MAKSELGLISNSMWSMSSSVWSMAVAFFLTPFLISKIGIDQYGLYMLVMSISGLLGVANLGLGEATLRYVSIFHREKDIDGVNRVIGSTLLIYSLIGLIIAILFYFFSGLIASWLNIKASDLKLVISILRITAFSFGLSFVTSVYGVIPQALMRFDITTKVAIVQSFFQVVGTVTLLYLNYGLYEIVLWGLVTTFFIEITNIVVAKRLIPKMTLIPKFSKAGLSEIFSYGMFSSVNGLVTIFSAQIDRILLATFVSPAAVAAYSMPKQILDRATNLTASASSVLLPKISSLSDIEQIKSLYKTSTWLLMTFSMSIFMPGIVFLPKFIGVWINPEIAETSKLLTQLLCINFAFRGISEPYFAVLKGTGNIRYLSLIFICTNLLGIILAFPFLYYFEINGAGYRAITLVWISIPISCWVLYRFLKDRSILNYLFYVLSSFFVSFIIITILLFIENFFNSFGLIPILLLWGATSVLITFLSFKVEKYFFNYLNFSPKDRLINLYSKFKNKINGKI